jgi:hypothetical protein
VGHEALQIGARSGVVKAFFFKAKIQVGESNLDWDFLYTQFLIENE